MYDPYGRVRMIRTHSYHTYIEPSHVSDIHTFVPCNLPEPHLLKLTPLFYCINQLIHSSHENTGISSEIPG